MVYGWEPLSLCSYEASNVCVAVVACTMADRDVFLANVRHRLEQAQQLVKCTYNRSHCNVSFVVDDWVWLCLHHCSPADIPDSSKGKLRPRFYGPYRIIAHVNPVAFCLELLSAARLLEVFHVGLLKKFVGSPPSTPPVLPPLHHGVVIPVLECALKARLCHNFHQLLIKWLS